MIYPKVINIIFQMLFLIYLKEFIAKNTKIELHKNIFDDSKMIQDY
jgi:hypothetical protein